MATTAVADKATKADSTAPGKRSASSSRPSQRDREVANVVKAAEAMAAEPWDDPSNGSDPFGEASAAVGELESHADGEKKPFDLTDEHRRQGIRWAMDEETGQRIDCPSCSSRKLVIYPRNGQIYRVCQAVLESEWPDCDYFVKVEKPKAEGDEDSTPKRKGRR